MRSLFLIQHATAAQEILDVPDDRLDRLRGQANRFGPGELLRILDLAGEAHIQLRQAVDNRLALEIAFARMARPELHASPASLLARVERLERMAGLEPGADPQPAAPEPAPAAPPRVELPQAAPPPHVHVSAPPTPVGDLDIARIQRAWPEVMKLVKKRKILAHAMLVTATPVAYEDAELTLEFDPRNRFHRDKVADLSSGFLTPLVEALFETFGLRPAIECVVGQNEARKPVAPAAEAEAPGNQKTAGPPKDPIDLIREGFAAEIGEETHG